MKTTQAHSLETLRAVQRFLDDHDAALPGVSLTGARRKLDEIVSTLDAHAATQVGAGIAAQMSTRVQTKLEIVLRRDHMTPIARIARAELPSIPDLSALRMPRGRSTLDKLAAHAYAMAEVAERHHDVFVAAGLPSDFAARLRGAAEEMLGARTTRTQRRGDSAAATAGLRLSLRAGRRIVGVLDAFVQMAVADDPSLRSSWLAVKRVVLPTRGLRVARGLPSSPSRGSAAASLPRGQGTSRAEVADVRALHDDAGSPSRDQSGPAPVDARRVPLYSWRRLRFPNLTGRTTNPEAARAPDVDGHKVESHEKSWCCSAARRGHARCGCAIQVVRKASEGRPAAASAALHPRLSLPPGYGGGAAAV